MLVRCGEPAEVRTRVALVERGAAVRGDKSDLSVAAAAAVCRPGFPSRDGDDVGGQTRRRSRPCPHLRGRSPAAVQERRGAP